MENSRISPEEHLILSFLSPIIVSIRNEVEKDKNRLDRGLKVIALMLKDLNFLEGKEEDLIDTLLMLRFSPEEAYSIVDYLNSEKVKFSEEDFSDPIVYEFFRVMDKNKKS
jgi:hypothetical protein